MELSQAGHVRESAIWVDSSSKHCLNHISFDFCLDNITWGQGGHSNRWVSLTEACVAGDHVDLQCRVIHWMLSD